MRQKLLALEAVKVLGRLGGSIVDQCGASDVRHRLAANMKRKRKERGRSQMALADEAGVDHTYLSSIERLVRNPTVTVIERIAKALACRFGDLLD